MRTLTIRHTLPIQLAILAFLILGGIACRGTSTGFQNQASAEVIETLQDLIGGPAAQGRAGDILLQNQHVRVIIQQAGRYPNALGQYGGTIIDADIARRPNEPGQDHLWAVVPWHNLARSIKTIRVRILDNGKLTGNAVVEVIAEDVQLGSLRSQEVSEALGGTDLDIDPTQPLNLDIRTRYRLGPESKAVLIETLVVSKNDAEIPLAIGDLLQVSGAAAPFFSATEGISQQRPSQGFGLPDDEIGYNGTEFVAWRTPSDIAYLYAQATETRTQSAGQTACLRLQTALGCLVGVQLSSSDGLTVLPDALAEQAVGFVAKPSGQSPIASFRRYFAIGTPGFAEAYEGVAAFTDAVLTPVQVAVSDPTGQPLEDADVALLINRSERWTPWLHTQTDDQGRATIHVPGGTYRLMVQKAGYSHSEAGRTPASVDLNIEPGAKSGPDLALELGPTGTVEFFSRDQNGEGIPARIVLFGQDPSPERLYTRSGEILPVRNGNELPIQPFSDGTGDGPPPLPSGFSTALSTDNGLPVTQTSAIKVVTTNDNGAVRLDLEPGNYTALASRGPAYELGVKRFTVASALTTRVLLDVRQTIDTIGFAYADFSVQSAHSPWQTLSAENALAVAKARGLDFATIRDRNHLAPFVEPGTTLTVGQGVQSFWPDLGALNISSLRPQPIPVRSKPATAAGESLLAERIDGGAPTWYAPGGVTFPGELLSATIDPEKNMLVTVPFVTHDYFGALGLTFDFSAGNEDDAQPAINVADPAITVDDAKQLYAHDWDAFEVAPDRYGTSGVWEALNFGFAYWNLGMRRPIVAGANHGMASRYGVIGTHTYVRHPTNASANFRNPGARNIGDLRTTIKTGRAGVSNGPLVTLDIQGVLLGQPNATTPTVLDHFGPAGIGELLTIGRDAFPSSGTDYAVRLTATIGIQSPTWAPPTHVQLFRNAAYQPLNDTADASGSFLDDVATRSWTLTETTLNNALTAATLTRGSGAEAVTIAVGAKRYDLTLTYNETIDAATFSTTQIDDVWFAVRVTGAAPLYPLSRFADATATPLAIANPVFIDLGGDAETIEFDLAYDGPCERANSNACPDPP